MCIGFSSALSWFSGQPASSPTVRASQTADHVSLQATHMISSMSRVHCKVGAREQCRGKVSSGAAMSPGARKWVRIVPLPVPSSQSQCCFFNCYSSEIRSVVSTRLTLSELTPYSLMSKAPMSLRNSRCLQVTKLDYYSIDIIRRRQVRI